MVTKLVNNNMQLSILDDIHEIKNSVNQLIKWYLVESETQIFLLTYYYNTRFILHFIFCILFKF